MREALASLAARPVQGFPSESVSAQMKGMVLVDGDLFGLPTEITVSAGRLYLIDRFRDESVVVLDRNSGAFLSSFGKPGEGPSELKSPMSLIVDDGDVAVLDPGLNRVTWLATRDNETLEFRETTSIVAHAPVLGFAVTSDDALLLAGHLSSSRLAIADQSGQVSSYIGEAHDLVGLSPARVTESFQGTLRGRDDRRRFVLTSRFASRIEIIDASTMAETTIWGPERFQPHAGKYETRFGYLDSAPMKDGFLALYSGRTRADFPGRANYGSTIHEFGWDGQLRAVYELDSDVISIAWSETDRLLYAVRHDPVPGVVVYALN